MKRKMKRKRRGWRLGVGEPRGQQPPAAVVPVAAERCQIADAVVAGTFAAAALAVAGAGVVIACQSPVEMVVVVVVVVVVVFVVALAALLAVARL